MHPAMFLRGSQARFTDPASGSIVQPGSISHSISDMMMAMLQTNFSLSDIRELSPDVHLANSFPRAQKYMGWPMVIALTMTKKLILPDLIRRY